MRHSVLQKSICLLLALVLLLLSGCTMLDVVQEPAEGEEEIVGVTPGTQLLVSHAVDDVFSLNYNPNSSLNPLVTTNEANLLFMPLIYEPLFEVDEHFDIVPKLVSSYETSDGRCWYFTVDTSRTFHNGNKLTAADAAYSVQVAMYSKQYSQRLDSVIGVSTMDEETFVVNISQSNYLFPALLNIPVIPYDTRDVEAPAGTGPYRWGRRNQQLDLYEDHPLAGQMPLETIYLKNFTQAGEQITAFEDSLLDLVTNDPNSINALGYGSANETRYYSTTHLQFIGYNVANNFFSDALRRAAMTYAIDRATIVTEIMNGCGTAAELPVNPLCSLYDATYAAHFSYDPDRFAAAMEEADVGDFDDDDELEFKVSGITVELSLDFVVCSESAQKVSAARFITSALNAMGYNVTLHEYSWDDYYYAIYNGLYDMYYGEIMLTADFDLSDLLSYGGAANYSRGYTLKYSDAISAYLGSAEEEDRKENFDLMCQVIAEDAYITAVCFEKRQVLTHRGTVSGINATQYNIFNAFQDWTIELT